MTANDLLNLIGDIDDSLIKEAESSKKKNTFPQWTRWAAMAACFCVVAISAIAISKINFNGNVSNSDAALSAESETPRAEQTSAESQIAADASKLTLRYLPGSSGSTPAVSSQSGAYYLQQTGDSVQVMYIDYATATVSEWGKDAATNQNSTSPGYIDDIFGGVRVIADQDGPYILKYGKLPIKSISYEGSPAYLSRLSLTGERKTIYFPAYTKPEASGGMASDGEELYLLTADYNASNERESYSICRTSFETESLTELASFPADASYYLVSAAEDKIILQKTVDNGENKISTLISYSLADNTFSELSLSWTNYELSYSVNGRYFYYAYADGSELHCFNAVTDEDSCLFTALTEDSSLYLTGDPCGEYLTAELCPVDGDSYTVTISLTDGTIKPVDLTYYYDEGVASATICAQTEDTLLVICEMKEDSYTITDDAGGTHTIYTDTPVYALISKEDYRTGIGTLQLIRTAE